ncbi:hypothetical protein ABL939_24315 [Escherichia albertii]|uniref:hypothetical protein n=1 Tax=Escherichia albertii TaxID=208962 RepID=UPI0010F6DB0E|nr:hypothetical protein [Escherichia albertii]MCZ8777519.1 hypothetical protein [Escherichia albertii]WDB36134.1 hypothetical protein PS032_10275 [Escherichia albertii]WDB72617.1 hypothetical protein PS034_13900 [Escherichia albertii]WDB80644.1 hypothetical protein PS039_08505 [Escherichia albertii]WDC00408.1 hypothetical protein PS046_14015 [Escherichia albertii]
MPNKKRNPLIEKQIECLVNQLRQSGLLKTHSELRLTESAFDDKLNNVLYNGIIDFNRSVGRRGPAGFSL